MDRKRISGAVMRRQLTETVDLNNPIGLMQATSVSSLSSSTISFAGLLQQNPDPPPTQTNLSSSSTLFTLITTMINSEPEAVAKTTSATLQNNNFVFFPDQPAILR
jgi:hypothetical protein